MKKKRKRATKARRRPPGVVPGFALRVRREREKGECGGREKERVNKRERESGHCCCRDRAQDRGKAKAAISVD